MPETPKQRSAALLAEHGVYVECGTCGESYDLRQNLLDGEFLWMKSCPKKCKGSAKVVDPRG